MSPSVSGAPDVILLRPVRVTVADDSLETRMLLRATLEGAGFEVVGEAIDGLGAIEVACERRPDVVLLDYLMPVLSGLEAIAPIREGSPESKILVLSAMVQDQVHDRLAQSAPDAWLAKDSDPRLLTEAVQRLAGLGGTGGGSGGTRPVQEHSAARSNVDGPAGPSMTRALADTRAALDHTFDAAPAAIALLTTSGRFIRVNAAYEELSGRRASELPDTWPETLRLSDAALAVSAFGPLLEGRINRYEARVRLHRLDGGDRSGDLRLTVLRNAAGLPVKFLAQVEDVTARVEAEEQLTDAFADAILPTGLVSPDGRYVQVNRALCTMLGRSEVDLIGAVWSGFLAAGPDAVSESLTDHEGRRAWDMQFVRPDASIRWGEVTVWPMVGRGDERLHDVLHIRDITARKEARGGPLGQDTHDPLTGLTTRAASSARLAAALAPVTGSSPSVDSERDLRRAVEAGELVVLYQPVVEFESRRVRGMEALVHWRHPDRGLVGPRGFLPLAENTGLIVPIGRTVIETACRQAQRWRESYPETDLAVGVNVSARELAEVDFCQFLEASLRDAGLPADRLFVEITETALAAAGKTGTRSLSQIKALGVCIALDEFGTGYSSRLQNMPIDVIKIDRSLIEGIGQTAVSTAIVGSIIRLADALQVATVAEGIEREEQHATLAALKCTAGQGHLYGYPAEPEDLDRLLSVSDGGA